ncbi:hypothetical protein [Altibacter sp. HG106]|uniref:hypothetical protein n=1 Tax=Altibacter sp. HG106 TaxID=3023937 RepID=UPI002350E4D6|nr:hypothetical protein [Altibacter sp. HG106]MDC7996199.1 hypothetical protein [Altibacter sp. HG106]
MNSFYKILITLILLPLMAGAHNDKFKGKYTKEKTLNKEYTVNANAGLEVTNSYGNIDIVTWNQNRTVIEVRIQTNGDNEEKVQKKLDDIDVEFSGNGTLVTAKTVFEGRKNSSWSWWGGNKNNVNMQIDYTIKLPVGNSVNLSNDYGAITLDRLEGNARINCDYGQLNIGELMADNNYLNFDYTKNSTITYMKSGKINADYSEFILEQVDRLELSADYSDSTIEEVVSLNYNNDYGKINVGQAGELVGRGDYIPLRLQTLKGNLNVNTDYGSVHIDQITAEGGDITIDADYATIKLGFDSGYNFNFKLDLSYANFKGEEKVTVTKSVKENHGRKVEGYHGSKNSGNTISVNSDYGNVHFE